MDGLKCSRCDCELELIEVAAEYLGHRFAEKIPGCPKCGQVYISEECGIDFGDQVEPRGIWRTAINNG